MTRNRWGLLALTAVLTIVTQAAQADTIRIDPGAYGSYYANGSVGRYGNYTLRPYGGGNLWGDVTGVQTTNLALLADGLYEIFARDANVVIGSFSNVSGVASAPSGAITLTGGTNIAFINKEIIVTGPAGWTSIVRIWNTAWSETGLTKFVIPVCNNWPGWWANTVSGTSFRFNVASNGDVTIASQSPNIGITGGNLSLKFPDEIEDLTFTISAQPSDMNRWSLDWVTDNMFFPPLTVNLKLYAATYWINNDGAGTWLGGNSFAIPVDTVNWQTVKTYSNAVSTYTWTISGPRYTPPTGSVIWQE